MRLSALIMALCLTSAAYAQTPAPAAPRQGSRSGAPSATPAPPAPAAVAVDPEAGGQPVNIRVDVSVTDQSGAGPSQPKTLVVFLADRAMGRTRSSFEDRSIDIDARPTIVGARIRLFLTISSQGVRPPFAPVAPDGKLPDNTKDWRNTFTVMLENGKEQVALENSDAAKGRKMSIEVKATILK